MIARARLPHLHERTYGLPVVGSAPWLTVTLHDKPTIRGDTYPDAVELMMQGRYLAFVGTTTLSPSDARRLASTLLAAADAAEGKPGPCACHSAAHRPAVRSTTTTTCPNPPADGELYCSACWTPESGDQHAWKVATAELAR